MLDDETKALIQRSRQLERENERYWTGKDCQDTSTAAEVVAEQHGHLTAAQRAKLIEKIEAAVPASVRNRGYLRRNLDKILAADPSLIARVPSAEELVGLLHSDAEPATRIDAFRRMRSLTEDERLALMPPPKTAEKSTEDTPEKPMPPAPNPYVDDIKTDEEIAQRLGYANVAALRGAVWPSRLRGYRAEIRKIAASSAVASVADVLRAKGVKSIEQIPDPQLRIALHRQSAAEKANGARPQEGSPQIINGMDVTSDEFRALPPQVRIATARKAGRK